MEGAKMPMASPAGDDVEDVVDLAAATPTQLDDQPPGETPPAGADTPPGAKPGEQPGDGVSPTPKDEPQSVEDAVSRAARTLTERRKALRATKNVGDRNADRSSSTPENGKKPVDPNAVPKPGEGDDKAAEEDTRFDKHPRFRKIISERDTLSKRVRELEGLEPDAKQFRQISDFVVKNNLSNDEVGQLFQVGALLKNDPFAAYKAIEPIWTKLQALVGNVLPPDIQDRLDKGLVDEETARELARARGQTQVRAGQDELAQRRQAAADAEANRQRAADEQAQQLTAFAGAVDAYWNTLAARDPDLADKLDLVEGRVAVLIQREGMPRTKEQAVAMTKKAYEEVSKTFGRFGPAAGARNTRPSPSSHSNGRATPSDTPAAAGSLMEAMQIGLSRTRGAA
jgi:hypothetical protein